MVIPIYVDGREEGTVTLERQGESVSIAAELRDVGRVLRLYVYGERMFYLGIPEPDGSGRLKLKKRLPCVRRCGFPQKPEYAAEKTAAKPTETEEKGRHMLWYGGKPHYF